MQKSINEILVLQKIVRERLNSLTILRNNCINKQTRVLATETIISESEYNPKIIDKKIVELQKFLLETDQMIKTSNAITKIEVIVDVDNLLAAIE